MTDNDPTALVLAALAGVGRRDRMVRDEPSRNPTKIRNRARDKRQKQARKANRRKA